jgi:hypothetical protein
VIGPEAEEASPKSNTKTRKVRTRTATLVGTAPMVAQA